LAYAAGSGVWFEIVFAVLVFGRTRYAVGLSAPICFAALCKFRFNPLRGFVVSQSPLPYRRRGVKPLAALRLAYRRLFLLIRDRSLQFLLLFL
jgi:hypothetical protein